MNLFSSTIWFAIALAVQLGTFGSALFQPNSQPLVLVPAIQQPDNAAALEEAARLNHSAVELFKESKFAEALPLAKRSLEVREKILGPDHELVQVSRLNLSEIYTVTKKYGEALKLVEQLVKTHEQKIGPEDPGLALYLGKLGFLAYVQGDFNKSELAYKRALAIQEKAFGREGAEYANAAFALAEFYLFRGKLYKAEPLYEQAARLRRKLLGREHPDYLKTKDRYFCVAYLAGQPERVKGFTEKLGDALDPNKPIDLLNGRALLLPRPEYTEAARRQGARGTVIIRVTVDELGQVIAAADMCSGDPVLIKPSIESALKAKFTPTKLSGKPVKVTGVVTYNYVIR
ncbi:MAG TPA: tetratricopeptide repeat protein [Pyrinomonadaceae bacterium]|nr:tetratricopeptide repeat protein [Pyrinomonadaceae bacterium]